MKLDNCEPKLLRYAVLFLRERYDEFPGTLTKFQRSQLMASIGAVVGAAGIIERLQVQRFKRRSEAQRKRQRAARRR